MIRSVLIGAALAMLVIGAHCRSFCLLDSCQKPAQSGCHNRDDGPQAAAACAHPVYLSADSNMPAEPAPAVLPAIEPAGHESIAGSPSAPVRRLRTVLRV
ncbi:MAG: hypothetical protein ACRD96_24075 [Bryobacteraceae bacterium]